MGRLHTTVIHAITAISKRLCVDPEPFEVEIFMIDPYKTIPEIMEIMKRIPIKPRNILPGIFAKTSM